jgi:hypothetical protein
MPEIDTYSPRKVTDQNRDLLPSTHDPKKRKTYVQVTLQEPEIEEAIRNYIRAQIPGSDVQELPVKIIAGRGENGHSATITLDPANVPVDSPTTPSAPMATFDAAAEDAARRNSEEVIEGGPEEQEAPEVEAAAPETGTDAEDGADKGPEPGHVQSDGHVVDVKDTEPDEPAPAGEPEQAPAETDPEPLTETETPEVVEAVEEAETVPEAAPETPPTPKKKSSLFDTPKQVENTTSAAEAAAAPPQADPEPETAASAPAKPKSIFDT